MKYKGIYLILGIVLMMGLASAESIGTYSPDTVFNITQGCSNATYVTVLAINGPTASSSLALNSNMTSPYPGYFYLTFNGSPQFGHYTIPEISDGCQLTASQSFDIGYSLTSAQSFIFLALFAFLILGLVGSLSFLFKSTSETNPAWIVGSTCLAYLSLFGIFFISWLFSSYYLYGTPVLSSIFWILWLIMAIGFLPFVFIVPSYILKKAVFDNLVAEYSKQGYSPEEAKEMAKSKRRRK